MERPAVYISGEVGEVSDGYHTFNELYDHRIALFIVLMRALPSNSWRSRVHDDGKGMEGWFIAGMKLPSGQISYHLPNNKWEQCYGIRELDRAPRWDGHTPSDVVKRLLEFWPSTPKSPSGEGK